MDVLVPPNGTNPGFVVNDETTGHRSHHGHHDVDWPSRTAERIKDTIAGLERSLSEQTRDVIEGVSDVSLTVEKIGAAGVLATNVAAGTLGVAIEKTSAAALLATNVVGQQIQNTLLSQFNATNVQQLTFFNALNVQAEKNVAATNLAIEKSAAAATLLATQNHAEALRQAAECCCELKELIRAENGQTRELIRDSETQRLRDALAASQNEVNLFKINASVGGPGNSVR